MLLEEAWPLTSATPVCTVGVPVQLWFAYKLKSTVPVGLVEAVEDATTTVACTSEPTVVVEIVTLLLFCIVVVTVGVTAAAASVAMPARATTLPVAEARNKRVLDVMIGVITL